MIRRVTLSMALLLIATLLGCSYYHVIHEGDTLYDLSREYGVSVQEIQRANPGVDPYNLQVGEKLKIPRFPEQQMNDYTGQQRTPRPTQTPTPKPVPTPDRTPVPVYSTPVPPQPTPTPPVANNPAGNSRFVWPVDGGRIVKRFGETSGGITSHGLDIEVAEGTPVRAAESGTVMLASNRFTGYGNMVIIKHEGGLVSIYAHNRSMKVKKDQQVKRGQVIAEVGQTGRVEKPTLHFEIRIGSQSVDPVGYLPPR